MVLQRPYLELVAAIDFSPALQGKDAGEILGKGKLGIPIYASIDQLPRKFSAQVVLHTTVSWLEDALPQINACIQKNFSVISTTEELLYPQWKYPDIARQLDHMAHKHKVAVLGTGVNPGFVLDTVAILLSAACIQVDSISLQRVVNAATRRFPLQKKIGAGMTVQEFRKQARSGRMGHVGFVETIALVAHAMGWKLDNIRETLKPKVADRRLRTQFLSVEPGQVTGIHQTCRGKIGRRTLIDADLQMYVGAPDPFDRIVVRGNPGIACHLEKGVAGDEATIAMLVNAIPLIVDAPPGLKTVLDLPLVRWTGNRPGQ